MGTRKRRFVHVIALSEVDDDEIAVSKLVQRSDRNVVSETSVKAWLSAEFNRTEDQWNGTGSGQNAGGVFFRKIVEQNDLAVWVLPP